LRCSEARLGRRVVALAELQVTAPVCATSARCARHVRAVARTTPVCPLGPSGAAVFQRCSGNGDQTPDMSEWENPALSVDGTPETPPIGAHRYATIVRTTFRSPTLGSGIGTAAQLSEFHPVHEGVSLGGTSRCGTKREGVLSVRTCRTGNTP